MKQDELKLVLEALKWCHGGEPCGTAEAIAVVEKALAQQKQEPVAWMDADGKTFPFVWNVGVQQGSKYLDETLTPLYTHSQRTWVGLTNEDVYEFAKAKLSWDELLIAAEAKLKEKNT